MSSRAPRPRTLVFGAIDFAALAPAGFISSAAGSPSATPRAVFATPARFPTADDVVVAWPHRYLAAGGAGGIDEHGDLRAPPTIRSSTSRCSDDARAWVSDDGGDGITQGDDRMDRLRAAGLTDAELVLSSPIGLDLRYPNPEETAVSIAADIIARRWGGGDARWPILPDGSTADAGSGRVQELLNSTTPFLGGRALGRMQVPGPFEYERATSVDRHRIVGSVGEGAGVRRQARPAADDESCASPAEVPRGHQRPGPELGYVVVAESNNPNLVRLGAMTRHREILDSDALAAVCPIFPRCRAGDRRPGGPQPRGTLGGSLCQADPAETCRPCAPFWMRGVPGRKGPQVNVR